ncbi:hypothetical protein [Sulfobacillus harzensis]|uniref:Uncharacterized protein n=1 Tax=Sulfobacillus harzensis TaxID=2729629 RepID=A0A7Y0Q3V7_9FIRM|nr:hypothetical protein [Sulfobacillus harzensis]NMP23386.1 hypothetical protein [Sulfobacillus harzensis]
MKSVKLGFGAKAALAAGSMVALLLVIPVTTSLGQGVRENVVDSWQGRYDHLTGQYYIRFLLSNGESQDIRLTGFPQKDLTHRGPGEFWTTPKDVLAVIRAAYHQEPNQLEQDLGTRANVADRLSPFPGRPAAYSAAFLNALTRRHFNPRVVGGPNIPPGVLDWNTIPDGVLQIDTLADSNTLHQLKPGQMPPALESWLAHQVRARRARPTPISTKPRATIMTTR